MLCTVFIEEHRERNRIPMIGNGVCFLLVHFCATTPFVSKHDNTLRKKILSNVVDTRRWELKKNIFFLNSFVEM